MIRVSVERKNDALNSIELSGHADSGPYGYDLVCAAVSGVSLGAVNAVMELSNVDLMVEQGGEGGYLKVTIPSDVPSEDLAKAQLLLEGMLVSLKSIEAEYGEHIRIDE